MNLFSLPLAALSTLDAIRPTLRRDVTAERKMKAMRRIIRHAAFDRSLRASRKGRNKWTPKAI